MNGNGNGGRSGESQRAWDWVGPPLDVRALFPLERRELLDLLGGLDAAAWDRATVCPGWTVRDVVAHLVHDCIRRLSGTRDRHRSAGFLPGEDLPAFLNRVNEEFVDVARRWSPRVLVELLAGLGPPLDEFWAGLDPHRVGEIAVSWAAPDVPAPVWLDVAREFSELWVHQQQIRDATGRPGADGEEFVAAVVGTLVRGLPHTLREHPARTGTTLAVEVTGPGAAAWTVTRGETSWSLAPADTRRADARIRLSSSLLWRLATGGLDVDLARAGTTVTGDPDLATAALHLVSVVR